MYIGHVGPVEEGSLEGHFRLSRPPLRAQHAAQVAESWNQTEFISYINL